MNRKLVAAIASVVLALISTLALVRYVQGAEKRARSGEELVEVLVARTEIKAGTPVTELADKVTIASVQAKVRPNDAVTNFGQIEGLVTAIDIVANEQLLRTRFINAGSFQGARSASALTPEGANEVTFKLAPERALGGQLRPGDTVSVLASFEPFDIDAGAAQAAEGTNGSSVRTPNTTHIILNRVTVLKVQFPEQANASSKEKNGVGVAPTEELLITLAVDQPALERAVFAAEFGKIWLSYEPLGANATSNKIVTRAKVYEATPSLLGGQRIPAADAASGATTTTVGGSS